MHIPERRSAVIPANADHFQDTLRCACDWTERLSLSDAEGTAGEIMWSELGIICGDNMQFDFFFSFFSSPTDFDGMVS